MPKSKIYFKYWGTVDWDVMAGLFGTGVYGAFNAKAKTLIDGTQKKKKPNNTAKAARFKNKKWFSLLNIKFIAAGKAGWPMVLFLCCALS